MTTLLTMFCCTGAVLMSLSSLAILNAMVQRAKENDND